MSRTLEHGVALEVFAFSDANEVETFVFASATEGGAFTFTVGAEVDAFALAASPELDAFEFAADDGVSKFDVSGSSLKSSHTILTKQIVVWTGRMMISYKLFSSTVGMRHLQKRA